MVLSLALSGCQKTGEPQSSGQAAPAAPRVGAVKVSVRSVSLSTELPGRTAASKMAEVRPQVTGIIKQRFFTEGEDVKAGQLLYLIDPATYQAAYNRAKAEQARAEADLRTIRLREQRYRDLVDINAVSRQEYDDTLAGLGQAEAQVEAARAALESARINLGYTEVKAPISGHIGRSAVTVGALVTANQPSALAVIHQLDPIYIDVTRSTSELLDLKRKLAGGRLTNGGPGSTEVSLLLETGETYPQPGRLQFSDVSVDPSTGSVVLRTLFPNPDRLLLPGMFVRAVVKEGTMDQAILVPQQGVARNPKGEAVAMVVNEEGKVKQRQLQVGRAIGDQWLVVSGLSVGDDLIVEGLQKVRPGDRVEVELIQDEGESVVEAIGQTSAALKEGGA
ncbi:efflux RND transporter periplasmic adaptor subunit [Desulfuromonas sp. KJ2020]|uniref:efflux RND transporter periplasmic adaptor subunit n=1 Tax=Desulfuromonas sp. KJ2020 TaxID=2919173 RepID=UPI00273A6805|nr:efflux RND transporter periplasmic adaptor subunit [Desulfuromonas sp. KJ2020]